MSALTFTLKKTPEQRIDCSPLTVDTLVNKSLAEIAAICLIVGNTTERVDNLFSIAGDDAMTIRFVNSCDKLDFIGYSMTTGQIVVEGDAGAYLGILLNGGQIDITGNTDIYTACEMQAGQIKVNGNTGDFVGAARPGHKNGMTGGIVAIAGNTGDRTGDHMRRGVILIEGNTGDYCGSRMIAGTVVALGDVGAHLGYAMKRGTLLLTNKPSQGISANFNDCGTHTLGFLPLLFNWFAKLDDAFASIEPFSRAQRYAGDVAGIGMGEILIKLE